MILLLIVQCVTKNIILIGMAASLEYIVPEFVIWMILLVNLEIFRLVDIDRDQEEGNPGGIVGFGVIHHMNCAI